MYLLTIRVPVHLPEHMTQKVQHTNTFVQLALLWMGRFILTQSMNKNRKNSSKNE